MTAVDMVDGHAVAGVRVELGPEHGPFQTVSTPSTVRVPAGTVRASVAAVVGDYNIAVLEPKSFTLAPGQAYSIVVKMGRQHSSVGAVSITKRDKVTGAVLAGARFRVTHESGDLVRETTTSAAGVATIGELPPGGYRVEEIAAPAGYVLDRTPHFIEVHRGKTRFLTFYDTPIEQPVVIRNPAHRVPLRSIPTGRIY
ncbi:MSCRAMM family protein [Gordonia shandongensis]|uniref:MSCRAMM family protein n=1 Tax=Gordonia shandongensis TaxID=376351 RepID=UPI0012EBAA8E|nr:SpaA isopeptide-forming pilin-related protein [Gordonia shandongensis]